MDIINSMMLDSTTILYFLMQILLGIAVFNQTRKGYLKTGISILILLTIYNFIFLNLFYIRK